MSLPSAADSAAVGPSGRFSVHTAQLQGQQLVLS